MAGDEEIIKEYTEKILQICEQPEQGLPEDVFLMISALIPVPNVDLLLLNKKNELLLSWRNDAFYPRGWSLIGGCLRYGETQQERIHKTALREIGQDVEILSEALATTDCRREQIQGNLKYQRMRGHHIAILYECRLTKDFDISKQKKKPGEDGYLQWFPSIPENMLELHHVYNHVFKKYNLLKNGEVGK